MNLSADGSRPPDFAFECPTRLKRPASRDARLLGGHSRAARQPSSPRSAALTAQRAGQIESLGCPVLRLGQRDCNLSVLSGVGAAHLALESLDQWSGVSPTQRPSSSLQRDPGNSDLYDVLDSWMVRLGSASFNRCRPSGVALVLYNASVLRLLRSARQARPSSVMLLTGWWAASVPCRLCFPSQSRSSFCMPRRLGRPASVTFVDTRFKSSRSLRCVK